MSRGRGRSVCTPQIVYLVETKSGEDGESDTRVSGRVVVDVH